MQILFVPKNFFFFEFCMFNYLFYSKIHQYLTTIWFIIKSNIFYWKKLIILIFILFFIFLLRKIYILIHIGWLTSICLNFSKFVTSKLNDPDSIWLVCGSEWRRRRRNGSNKEYSIWEIVALTSKNKRRTNWTATNILEFKNVTINKFFTSIYDVWRVWREFQSIVFIFIERMYIGWCFSPTTTKFSMGGNFGRELKRGGRGSFGSIRRWTHVLRCVLCCQTRFWLQAKPFANPS